MQIPFVQYIINVNTILGIYLFINSKKFYKLKKIVKNKRLNIYIIKIYVLKLETF